MSCLAPDVTKATADTASRGIPLAWHLAVLCFVLILPILLLAAMLAWFYAQSEHQRIEQDALRTARSLTAVTDGEVAGLIATAEVLALARALQADDLDAFDAQAREVYQQLGSNVVVRGRDGRQLVNTRVPRSAPLPIHTEPESDRAVMETKRPFVSNLFTGAIAQRPLIIVSVPVLRRGDIAYLLNLTLEPDRIADLLARRYRPSGWTTAVVDRRGRVIAYSSEQEMIVGQSVGEAIWNKIEAQDGSDGELLVDAPDGRVLVAFSRSQLSGWVAVISLPEALVTAPVRRSLYGLLAMTGFILAFALGLAFTFSRRIERPVAELATEAARLGRGEALRPLVTRVRQVNVAGAALSKAGTARLMAEAAVRASEERYRALASATREGVAIHDKWRVMEANDAFWAMFGYASREEVVGRRPLRFIASAARQRTLVDARATWGKPYESVGHRRDGSDFPIEICCKPVLYHGRPVGVTVVRDLTLQKDAEEHLRELQLELLHASRLSAMGQMAAALAHELNQPLGAATNFLSAARLALKSARPDAPGRALASIESAVEQTIRAGAILSRLRDYIARGETEKRLVSARQLVEDGVALALVGTKDPKLRTRIDFDPRDLSILADRIQIQQVIFNLVRNALEATEGKVPRVILVATRATAERALEISVADNGPGLQEDPEMLFRPFATTKPKGMGIGLSICRTIVEAHGGRLWAEPRPGGGAVFRFTVPAATDEEDVTHG